MSKRQKVIVKMCDGDIYCWDKDFSRAAFTQDGTGFEFFKPDNKDEITAWFNTDYVASIIAREYEEA